MLETELRNPFELKSMGTLEKSAATKSTSPIRCQEAETDQWLRWHRAGGCPFGKAYTDIAGGAASPPRKARVPAPACDRVPRAPAARLQAHVIPSQRPRALVRRGDKNGAVESSPKRVWSRPCTLGARLLGVAGRPLGVRGPYMLLGG